MSAQEISALVGDRGRTWAVALPSSFGRRWQDALNDPGSGALSNPNDDAATAWLQRGNVITFWLGVDAAFSMLIEKRTRSAIAPGEEVDEITTAEGRGQVVVLEEGIVAPLGDEDTRAFNFASPLLDDSGWIDAIVSAPVSMPQGWPDPGSLWVWDRDPLTPIPPGIPAGDTYWRKHFVTAATKTIDVWCVADDGYEIWLDGKRLFDDTLDAAWTGVPKNQTVFLPAGAHVIAVHARNNNALLAGLRVAVVEKDAHGTQIGVLLHSDATWQLLAYPPEPPGFTPGQIMGILLAEAQARGALVDLAVDFTDTHDSAGVPWPTTSEVSVPVGSNMLAVLQQLADGYADYSMAVTSLTLSMFVHRGGATAAALTAGGNLVELTFEDS